MTLTVNEVSELTGWAHATARKKLQSSGIKADHGKYDVRDIIKALAELLKLTTEKQRILTAQASLKEHELSLAQGGHMPIDEVKFLLSDLSAKIVGIIGHSNLTYDDQKRILDELAIAAAEVCGVDKLPDPRAADQAKFPFCEVCKFSHKPGLENCVTFPDNKVMSSGRRFESGEPVPDEHLKLIREQEIRRSQAE